MNKKIIAFAAFFGLLLFSTPAFAAVQSGTSSSSLLNIRDSQYYQNPKNQQQATNINSTASGSLLLQQAPAATLTVDSPVLNTNTPNKTTNNRAGLYLTLAILAVFFMGAAIVMYVLAKKQPKVQTKEPDSPPKAKIASSTENMKEDVSENRVSGEEILGAFNKPAKEKSNKQARRKRKKHHR